MNTPPDNLNDQQLAQLIEVYLLGTITDEQIDAFEAGLLQQPKAADLCAEAIETVAMTREVFRDDQEQRAILKRDETVEGFHTLLAELGEAEERAETQLVHVVGQLKTRRPLWQQWQFMIPSGIAAILAIAVILIVTVPTGSPTSITGTTPPKPAAMTQSTPRESHSQSPVATITATHNAKWSSPQAEGASAPGSNLSVGSPLHPNQRLTLTQGFAEITTNRGAIAILQAPATIELLDNDNALHLHSGKLVGICETQSSKGFLVRTPHMDITDLGTRFGVDASPNRLTTTVFEGEVQVRSAKGTKQSLTANQTARLSLADDKLELVVEEQLARGFDALLASPMLDPLARLRPQLQGDAMQWVGTMPNDLRSQQQRSDRPQIFVERQRLTLNEDLVVDVTADRPVFDGNVVDDTQRLAAGTNVTVYFIHLQALPNTAVKGDYVLHFDGTIAGVIASGQRLIATDPTLGKPGVRYPDEPFDQRTQNRGCDQVPGYEASYDTVRIDQSTLRLSLVNEGYIDQLRVLVIADQAPASPDTP